MHPTVIPADPGCVNNRYRPVGYDRAPGPDCWLAFSLREPGRYTATLTVTSPEGYTDSVSQPFFVFEFRLAAL